MHITRKPWPIGKSLECTNCGCGWKINHPDDVNSYDRIDEESRRATCLCPLCGTPCHLSTGEGAQDAPATDGETGEAETGAETEGDEKAGSGLTDSIELPDAQMDELEATGIDGDKDETGADPGEAQAEAKAPAPRTRGGRRR